MKTYVENLQKVGNEGMVTEDWFLEVGSWFDVYLSMYWKSEMEYEEDKEDIDHEI